MRAVKILEPGRIIIDEIDIPAPGPHDVVIKVLASGICGTDVHIYKGEYLGTYPVIPGHEGAGFVESVGAAVSGVKPGDSVAFEPNISCGSCVHCQNNRQNFCEEWFGIGVTRDGCMAEYVLSPDQNVFNTSGLGPKIACYMEPLSCVIHGIQKASIRMTDRVLLAGAGPIGLLLLQAAQTLGAGMIDVVERNPSRRRVAADLGADQTFESFDELEVDRYDVVIDATGAIPVLEKLIQFSRFGGTMLFFGVAPSGEMMKIEPFQIFKKGLTIVSSYTSLRKSLQAVELLRSGAIKVDTLTSHIVGLDDMERGIGLLETGSDGVMKVIIDPTI
ncbi:MAG: alcohol dehydrogenase catalytic domain-containing protein [Spirochaetales bacterium]|jgi:D-arabinitol dehydrogenase (NADP+)|nr:alcohol dehydrogenase catalytic domain-containing protein [Spirochaetales bacterium]